MDILLPQNIFAAIFALSLPADNIKNIIVKESSLIARDLELHEDYIGLMPSCDLIDHRDLYVSSKIGISFDGELSNAYFYFLPEQKNFDKVFLRGDISKNEVILPKILFNERFSADVEFVIDKEELKLNERNYIIVGNENLSQNFLKSRISLADEIAELLNAPYTNYLLTSKNKDLLTDFTIKLTDLDKIVEDNINKILNKIDLEINMADYIRENLGSIYFEITETEIDSINELIKLLFYHGFVDDIFDIKFV
ncbi:hypothetical protein ABRY23_07820 [Melioribacteraceae bacterium 4301-Me]|uniref:hypothetical protein n=1 Tax=Pyranulibacter aquaticus TaxID=3163344 RepID=UPI00359BBBE7